MLKRNYKQTLADKISDILTTAPVSADPEYDAGEETNAKIVENDSENENDDEILLSKFRRQNIDLLEDVDTKYSGRKRSRKDLRDSDSESSVADNLSDENSKGSDGESEESSDDIDYESEGKEDEENTDEDDKSSNDDLSADDTDFKHINDTDIPNQLKKGTCVRNQLNIWENLLEIRIQLQKCLITANKMPQTQTFTEIKNAYRESFTSRASETRKSVQNVLDKLLHLQSLLLQQYPETKDLFSKAKKDEVNNDEEIPSDTEDEDTVEKDEIPLKRRKFSDYERDISTRHVGYEEYRNSVMKKWNDKTKIVTAKNNPMHSVLSQIAYNLSDKAKLIKRTQIKRSDYKILGEKEPENSGDDPSCPSREHNVEIFDDDDFYHQLLRELIEVKSADVTDPVQLGRQWIQLQSLRSKMKRKIDTRATKGRKVRYTVHSKLVNFMAPIDNNAYMEEAKNELFSSLFGKNRPIHTV